jgi:hypothetical protein
MKAAEWVVREWPLGVGVLAGAGAGAAVLVAEGLWGARPLDWTLLAVLLLARVESMTLRLATCGGVAMAAAAWGGAPMAGSLLAAGMGCIAAGMAQPRTDLGVERDTLPARILPPLAAGAAMMTGLALWGELAARPAHLVAAVVVYTLLQAVAAMARAAAALRRGQPARRLA